MKYRSRTELIAVILSSAAVEKGVLLTRIMYTSFLSYGQMKQYFGLLLDHGLLEYEEEYKVYKTTKKGLQYLELYEEMDELIRIK
jgi:predicted transcriptional regulator